MPPSPATTLPLDIHHPVHKALRAGMADTLLRLGRLDLSDDASLQPALQQLDSLLALLAAQLRHEGDHVHTAIEARQPGCCREQAALQAELLQDIGDLHEELQALRLAAPGLRQQRGHRVYRHLARLVGRRLEQMAVAESSGLRTLKALYDETELQQLQERLLAALQPLRRQGLLQWMAQGLNPQELADVMAALQDRLPADEFAAALASLRAGQAFSVAAGPGASAPAARTAS